MAVEKKTEIIDGYTIKYHANGKTRWSKGKVVDGEPLRILGVVPTRRHLKTLRAL
jgi:hypothetical protein